MNVVYNSGKRRKRKLEKIFHLENHLAEIKKELDNLKESLSDESATELSSFRTELSSFREEESKDGVLTAESNIEEVYIAKEVEDNHREVAARGNLYNTGGVYFHSIITSCYQDCGVLKSWMLAFGVFLMAFFQIMILNWVYIESEATIRSKEETEVCAKSRFSSVLVLLLMSFLFGCILYEDVKESVIEEALLNHAIVRRRSRISSLRAVEAIRFCLRIRRFILPWHLARSAVWLIVSVDVSSTNQIILNFLSIGFIAEVDNFLGSFFYTESCEDTADEILESVRADFDESEHYPNLITSSFLWPRTLAVLPTLSITIVTIGLMNLASCVDKLFFFYVAFACSLLPNLIIIGNGIAGFVRDKQRPSLSERYIRCMSDMSFDCASYMLITAYFSCFLPLSWFRYNARFLAGFILELYCLVAFFFIRDYHSRNPNYEGKTWKDRMFCLFCMITTVAYMVNVIGTLDFFLKIFARIF